jgi:hypothetical protein
MGQLHFGVHQQLEDAATEIIRKSLEGVTSMSAKSDILTPWKEQDRKRREVYTLEGVPDGALRRGMYHRAWNSTYPHLNSADGKVRPRASDLSVGQPEPRFARSDDEIQPGDIYDLRIQWGKQVRIKCPICSKYIQDALEIVCRCGSVFSKCPEEGHFQVVRIRHG